MSILKKCNIQHHKLTENSIEYIKSFLINDHSISMIPETEYDAILIRDDAFPVEVGKKINGFIFNDTLNRFNDASHVITSTVQEIAIPVDGLKLVKTRNTTYLTW